MAKSKQKSKQRKGDNKPDKRQSDVRLVALQMAYEIYKSERSGISPEEVLDNAVAGKPDPTPEDVAERVGKLAKTLLDSVGAGAQKTA